MGASLCPNELTLAPRSYQPRTFLNVLVFLFLSEARLIFVLLVCDLSPVLKSVELSWCFCLLKGFEQFAGAVGSDLRIE